MFRIAKYYFTDSGKRDYEPSYEERIELFKTQLMTKKELDELIRKVKGGNKQAQQKLVLFIWEFCVEHVKNKLQSFSYDDKVAIVDFFINKIWNSLDRYEPKEDSSFNKYIRKIIRNAKIDYFKKNFETKSSHFHLTSDQIRDWPFLIDSLSEKQINKNIQYRQVKLCLCTKNLNQLNQDLKILDELLSDYEEQKTEIVKRFNNKLLTRKDFYNSEIFPYDIIPDSLLQILFYQSFIDIVRRNRYLLEIVYPIEVLQRCGGKMISVNSFDDASDNNREIQITYDHDVPDKDKITTLFIIDIINEEFNKLSPVSKEIIELTFFRTPRKTPKEISEQLGIKKNKVYQTIRQFRVKLRPRIRDNKNE